MAADRRIIIGTHVSPQKYTTVSAVEGTLENVNHDRAAYNKYKIDSTVGKTLGGHSSSPNHVANTTSQDWDGWTSMEHPKMYWEAHDAADTDTDGKWDTAIGGEGIWWDGTAEIGTGAITPSNQTEDMVYCYIKNVGSTAIYVSLNGGTKYQIKISPNAAFSCRGHGNTEANDIRIKTLSSTSYAEFVIAI
jgi:hypothetical protein|tara:strand:- start:357 stop:929 length:573 start_codon:yes stop_codon:yes gene_type:complete